MKDRTQLLRLLYVIGLVAVVCLFIYDVYLTHQSRVHLSQAVEQSRQAGAQISSGLQWKVVGEHKCPRGYKADHVGNHVLCPDGEICEDFVACFPTKILNRCK